jgi:hypothetical protein
MVPSAAGSLKQSGVDINTSPSLNSRLLQRPISSGTPLSPKHSVWDPQKVAQKVSHPRRIHWCHGCYWQPFKSIGPHDTHSTLRHTLIQGLSYPHQLLCPPRRRRQRSLIRPFQQVGEYLYDQLAHYRSLSQSSENYGPPYPLCHAGWWDGRSGESLTPPLV